MQVSQLSTGENGSAIDSASMAGNPLRPVLVAVFSLKLVVAAFLLASVSLSPPLAARGGYSASE